MTNLSLPPASFFSSKASNARMLRNIEWLSKDHSALASLLERPLPRRFYKPIIERGRIINLETGGTRLYDMDAREHASNELKSYFSSKPRYIHPPIRHFCPSSAASFARMDMGFKRDLDSVFLRDRRLHPKLRDAGNKERSLLVIFGLGLGYHIAPLIRRLRPCNVCIIETRQDSLYFSSGAHDFSRWHDLCRARKGRLYFILEDDVEGLESSFRDFLFSSMYFFADSFFFYRHATISATLERLYPHIMSIINLSATNMGYFEDQIRMLENSRENLSLSVSTPILQNPTRLRPKREILIIANGPSLDDSLAYLSRLCVGRVVFSCGSALYTLLKNGIVPDYHCEIENIFPKFNHITKALEDGYNLDEIILFASVTVQPDVVSEFKKRVLFLRALTPFSYLSELASLSNVSPTVSNTALSCASALGFSKYYFLGVDMGYKGERSHHAKDAVHFIYKDFAAQQERQMSSSKLLFRGNFGGYVRSQDIFLVSKHVLEVEAQSRPRNYFYNCSDGAKLKGFIPLLPTLIEQLPLPPSSSNDSQAEERLYNLCPKISLADESILLRIDAAEEQRKFFADSLLKILTRISSVEEICDLQDIHNLLRAFLFGSGKTSEVKNSGGEEVYNFCASFYMGTIFILFGYIYNIFIKTSNKRWRRLRAAIATHLEHRLQQMDKNLEDVFANSRAHFISAKELSAKRELSAKIDLNVDLNIN